MADETKAPDPAKSQSGFLGRLLSPEFLEPLMLAGTAAAMPQGATGPAAMMAALLAGKIGSGIAEENFKAEQAKRAHANNIVTALINQNPIDVVLGDPKQMASQAKTQLGAGGGGKELDAVTGQIADMLVKRSADPSAGAGLAQALQAPPPPTRPIPTAIAEIGPNLPAGALGPEPLLGQDELPQFDLPSTSTDSAVSIQSTSLPEVPDYPIGTDQPHAPVLLSSLDSPVTIEHPGVYITGVPAINSLRVSGLDVDPMDGDIKLHVSLVTADQQQDAILGAFAIAAQKGLTAAHILPSMIRQGLMPTPDTLELALGGQWMASQMRYQAILSQIAPHMSARELRLHSSKAASREVGGTPPSQLEAVEEPLPDPNSIPQLFLAMQNPDMDTRLALENPDRIGALINALSQYAVRQEALKAGAVADEELLRLPARGQIEAVNATLREFGVTSVSPIPAEIISGTNLSIGTTWGQLWAMAPADRPIKVSEADKQRLMEIETSLQLIDQVETFSKQIFTSGSSLFARQGRGLTLTAARLMGTPLGDTVKTYDTVVNKLLAIILARGVGEKGVLTEGDAERARLSMPNAGGLLQIITSGGPDSARTAQLKVALMRRIFVGRLKMATQVATGFTTASLQQLNTMRDETASDVREFDALLTPAQQAKVKRLDELDAQRRALKERLNPATGAP